MKPIVFFDLETTGTVIGKDRIVEIGMMKIKGDERTDYHALINPGIQIPVEASDIHGITNEKVKDMPRLEDLAKEITAFIYDCDLGGFNSNMFDIPFLYNELYRCGCVIDLSTAKFVDVGVIFKRLNERTLSAAVKHYLGKEHEDAHGAMPDIEATYDVLVEMRKRHEELGKMSLEELSFFCNYDRQRLDISGKFDRDADGDYIFTFGQHRGEKAKKHKDFLNWMLGKDFLPDTKEIARKVYFQK